MRRAPARGGREKPRRIGQRLTAALGNAAGSRLPAALRAVTAPGLLALALIAALIPFMGAPGAGRAWRGYQVLLISPAADREGAVGRLGARFGPGVIDSRAATMRFWSFDGMESVPIAAIEKRLDPRDPRYDAYMAAVPGYFRAKVRGNDWRVVYLPARMPAPLAYLRLIGSLGFPLGGAWRLIEFDPIEKGLSLIVFFCVVPLLAFSRGKSRREEMGMALAGAALWIPCLLAGGLSCFALALLLFMAWHPVMQAFLPSRGWDSRVLRDARPALIRYLAAAAVGCVLLLPVSRFSLSAPLLCLGPVAASLLMPAGLARLKDGAVKHRKRRVKFEPIPIVRPRKKASHGRTAALLLSLFALACIGCIPVMRGARMPVPLAAGARGFSWESLAATGTRAQLRLLPGYADLVTHEAYQETLAFGRPWRTPARDERVHVREYLISPATGVIQARERTVKVFDSTWRESVRRSAVPGTLEALLFSQGRPVSAMARGQSWLLLMELPVMLAVAAALLFLLIRDDGVGPLIQCIHLRFNRRARRNQVP